MLRQKHILLFCGVYCKSITILTFIFAVVNKNITVKMKIRRTILHSGFKQACIF